MSLEFASFFIQGIIIKSQQLSCSQPREHWLLQERVGFTGIAGIVPS